MWRPGSASAPRGTAGTCRDLRRARRGRQAAWAHPFRQIHRALDASLRIIDATLREVETSERCAVRRPVRARRKLRHACYRVLGAESRLVRATRGLDAAKERMASQPMGAAGVAELFAEAAERCTYVRERLEGAAEELFLVNYAVVHGLETGELVPEPPAERARRIVLVPRPTPVRAFLRARLPRVVDRISSVLQRRRRTRRPAALRVPRRTSQGRAPPLVPVCLL